MSTLLRALDAERLKLKQTLASWVVVLAPLSVAVLVVLEFSMAHTRHAGTIHADAWFNLCKSIFTLWCFFMLPLFITLESALLAALEHGNAQWKHLLALPVSRSSHYLAKWLILTAMTLAASLVLFVLTPCSGWVLMRTQPAFGLADAPIPLGWLFLHMLASVAAAGIIVAVQIWVALRWRSFTVAVTVGMVATVAGFIVGQSPRFGRFFPWSMPLQIFAGHDQHMTFVLIAGLGGGILIAILGLLDFRRREYG